VIIDLGLPDISGLEVLNKVKAEFPFTEAIILTGNASLESAIEATNKGAFSYLLKPYDIEGLMLHIRRALEKQQALKTIAKHTDELEIANTKLRKANTELTNEIAERKRAEEEREQLIGELKDALSKIKVLTGFLPICANCKKVRNDKGHWESIEDYIRERSEAKFSHGICPECGKKLYPEYFEEE
jgi:response regulator RpfG family c-di-GMP phosphodiesterase